MVIQLKTGKCINLTLEQYLDMSDEEYEFLNNPAYNIGSYPGSVWQGSQIQKKTSSREYIVEDMGFQEDSEEFYQEPITENDEISDLPEIVDLGDIPDED